MGFKISIIRADNGTEFVNYEDRTDKSGRFRKIAESLGMRIRRTRPYSPWQNGKAERSHREDGKILYGRKVFTNETELKKQVRKHENRYNRTAKTSLDFKSPDRVAGQQESIFQSVTYVLTVKKKRRKKAKKRLTKLRADSNILKHAKINKRGMQGPKDLENLENFIVQKTLVKSLKKDKTLKETTAKW